MDNTVWIVLIVAGAVLLVLFMFRGVLSKFFLKANREGVEAGIETRESHPVAPTSEADSHPYAVNISRNKQLGMDNKIDVAQSNVNISDNTQAGRGQAIEVKPKRR